VASAEALAIFRVMFGAACVAYFVTHPVDAEWLSGAYAESGLQRIALDAFRATPAAVALIQPWIVFWGVAFIAGAMARLSFVMLTLGAFAWGLIFTVQIGSHSVEVPLVTMLCLLWSRWGDAWSLDAWWRNRRRPVAIGGISNPRSRAYGYSMWIPGLVLGTSLAAAAYSKMRESGLAWILNGSVKYHFLSDAHQAPVDWGLRLAQNDLVAILLSFAGVATEALIIVGVCCTMYRYRLAAGTATAALMLAFWLFQGLFWPFWAIMMLTFLPWHRIRAPRPHPAAAAPPASNPVAPRYPYLRWAQLVCGVIVVGQQVVVSAYRAEYAPLASAWNMYSTTYASTAEY
jgi:hypothetical protein